MKKLNSLIRKYERMAKDQMSFACSYHRRPGANPKRAPILRAYAFAYRDVATDLRRLKRELIKEGCECKTENI